MSHIANSLHHHSSPTANDHPNLTVDTRVCDPVPLCRIVLGPCIDVADDIGEGGVGEAVRVGVKEHRVDMTADEAAKEEANTLCDGK